MLRRLYNWTMAMAGSRFGMWALGVISFIEASVFPIPPDALLVPMVIAKPRKALRIAAVATLGSVLGALLGYAIGFYLLEEIGRPILAFYGKENAFAQFAELYNTYGAELVLIAGLTPFPFKVITILSGMTKLSLPTFLLYCLIARSARFFFEAALLWKFGEPIRIFVEKYLGWVATLALALLLGGFAALYWI